MPGTYTENPSLKVGVNLAAFGSDSSFNETGNVIINGTCTLTAAGTVTIFGIQLQTNANYALVVSGSAASIVNLNNCNINITSSNGINFTSSSASSAINLNYCTADVSSSSYNLYGMTSLGTLNINHCVFTNSAGTTTSGPNNTAGIVNIMYSNIPWILGTSAILNLNYCYITGTLQTIHVSNTTILTMNFCYMLNTFISNNFNIGATTTVNLYASEISTSSSPAINVAGTLNYGALVLSGSNQTISGAGTITPWPWPVPQGGTGLTTTVANQIIYSSSAGVIAGLATGNSGVLDTTASGVPQIDTTNFHVLTTGVQVKGNNASTTPPAGFIGEQIRSAVAQGSAITLTNTSPANITSISLTAGIWDISATGIVNSSGANTSEYLSVGTSSATLGTVGDNATLFNLSNTGGNFPLAIPSWRLLLASTTPVYLVAQANFTTGGGSAWGRISATRVG
jgi:hypothetical protein